MNNTDGVKSQAFFAIDALTDGIWPAWLNLPVGATSVTWNWMYPQQGLVLRTDRDFPVSWSGHDGPLWFYAESADTALTLDGKFRGSDGNIHGWKESLVYHDLITSVEKISADAPVAFGLLQNYPNPFNPTSTIEFSLSTQSRVKLIVYDILGRQVEELIDKEFNSGVFRATWDGANSASGFYYYRLLAIPLDGSQPFVQSRKMILAK